jgi:hypothetical protein
LFSGSSDGTVKCWDVLKQELQFSLQLAQGIRAAEITTMQIGEWTDENREESRVFLFVGHMNGLVRVWDLTMKAPMFGVVLEREIRNDLQQRKSLSGNWIGLPVVHSLFDLQQQQADNRKSEMLFGIGQSKFVKQDAFRVINSQQIGCQKQRLIPKAIGLSVPQRQKPCELLMIGVDSSEEGSDGEYQVFEFKCSTGSAEVDYPRFE